VKTGAVVGSFVCPGFGTAIGGLLGILTGAAAGAVAGNTVGKLVDENIFRIWRCTSCDYEWRVA
jgi:outer membrane lipoprotein SlyB